MRQIIEDRKKASDTANFGGDIISLLLQDESYQDTEAIIDDIIVMFIAGSKTVQSTTSNLITTMLHEPEVYAKLKAEVDPFMSKVKDDIMGKMNLESVEDLEYVKMCY